MHVEVLSEKQRELLPLIEKFSRDYFLVGGTAVALHIGHRRSIDFDLFTDQDIKRTNIKNVIDKTPFTADKILYEAFDQIHIIVNAVKLTFFNFPYAIRHPVDFEGIITIPSLLDLGAMKTYALGKRAKWKDYVDLYFIMKYHHNFKDLSQRAGEIFGAYYNEKLFREQLSYFDDIDYSEKIDYMEDETDEKIIKEFLVDIATARF